MKVSYVLSLLSRLASVLAARTMVARLRRIGGMSRSSGVLAIFLVLTQVIAALPVSGNLRSDGLRRPAPEVAVNRTQPVVEAPPIMPVFSVNPTDAEITRARVFEEPLVRTTPPVSHYQTDESENRTLAQAMIEYLERNDPEDISPFAAFLAQYPRTSWRVSLVTNLGVVYRRTGYFLKALEAWEEAWKLGKGETDGDARAIVDKAVGELAELNARLGRYDRLEKLFGELGNREVHGPATEKLTGAREGLSVMRNQPGIAFRCGPMALDRVRAAANPGDAFDPKISEAQSTRRGLSLANLMRLANELKMNYQMAYRAAGAVVTTSAVVHWKVDTSRRLLPVARDRQQVTSYGS